MNFRKSFEYIYENSENNLASIIIVNFNNADLLNQSLKSALNQSYKNKK